MHNPAERSPAGDGEPKTVLIKLATARTTVLVAFAAMGVAGVVVFGVLFPLNDSLSGQGRGWLMAGTALVCCAGTLAALLVIRRWRRLPKAVTGPGATVRVVGVAGTPGGPILEANRQRAVIQYRPQRSLAPGGFVAVYRRGDRPFPQPDETLVLWPVDARSRRGPFAIRRLDDLSWWIGSGPDPIPAADPD